MSSKYGKGRAEATVHAGTRRKDGGQEYVITKHSGQTRTVVTTAESVRSIRSIMSNRSDLMRKLADR